MKKEYTKPTMYVDDFTMSEMVAKCEFITNNSFTAEIARGRGDHPCELARLEAYNRGKGPEYEYLSTIYNASGDFDNADKDNNWGTNNTGYNESIGENKNVFISTYATADICQIKADTENISFMNYAHDGVGAYPKMSACTKDTGSSLLQNS